MITMKFKSYYTIAIVLFAHYAAASISQDSYLSVPQLIVKNHYPFEGHFATTSDGYILALHRIPNNDLPFGSRRVPPVLLLHGLWSSSIDFVIQGPGNSLGYMLADSGYDVWMGNTRGGLYSKNHTTYNPSTFFLNPFWDFSVHEKGVYDLPAMIDYIMTETNSPQVLLVGLSEGAAAFFVMGSEVPSYLPKVKAHVAYAPSAFITHTSFFPLRLLSFIETFGYASMLTNIFGQINVAGDGLIMHALNWLCNLHFVIAVVCDSVLSPVLDSEPGQISSSLFDVILGHLPAPTSSKQLIHLAQNVKNRNFAKYQKKVIDPVSAYHLNGITTPIYIFCSKRDRMVSPTDINTLQSKLGMPFVQKNVLPHFGHVDFAFGKNASLDVYVPTITILNSLSMIL